MKNEDYIKKRIFFISAILISFLVLNMPFIYMDANERKLNHLTAYLDGHDYHQEHMEQVLSVIEEIADLEEEAGYYYLENLFAKSASSEVKVKILEVFLEKDRLFSEIDYAAKLSIYNGQQFPEAVRLLKRYDGNQIDRYFFTLFGEKISQKAYYDVRKYLSFYESNIAPENSNIATITQCLNEMEVMLQTRNDTVSQLEETEREIKRHQRLIEIKKQEFSRLRQAEDKAQRFLTQASLDLLNKGDIINLEFYMMGFHGPEAGYEVYEIAFAEYEPHLGRVPSRDDRAILKVYTISYHERGWTNLEVIYSGRKEFTLRNEYGGFRRTWPVYIQATEHDKQQIDTMRQQVIELEKAWQNQSRLYQEAAEELTRLENDLILIEKEVAESRVKAMGTLVEINRAIELKTYEMLSVCIDYAEEKFEKKWQPEVIEASLQETPEEPVSVQEAAPPVRRRFDVDDLDVHGLSISRHREADIITRFGAPEEIIEVRKQDSMDYSDWKHLTYEGFTATVVNYEYPNNDFILNQVEIHGRKIPGPRGIEIGDSVEEVLKHFPDENNQTENMTQDIQIRYLYGSEYAHKGVVYYDNDKEISAITFVHYIDTSFFAVFDLEIKEGRVAGMSIRF